MKKIRNIIDENRVRVALQSEMTANFEHIDDDYKKQVYRVIKDGNGNVIEKLDQLRAQHGLVHYEEDEIEEAANEGTYQAVQARIESMKVTLAGQ